jgi:uncharacterized repeat protein (TIGR02543 family)
MHAQWQADADPLPTQYTLSFDTHGGPAVAAITAAAGTAVSKPANPDRTGYTFTGWYSAASGGMAYTWPHSLNASVTMHAQWTAVNYGITYNLNGGTNVPVNPASYTVENSITLTAPNRTGYAFAGWYDNANCTGTVVTTISAGSTGHKTFWARWLVSYTITYNLNNGTNSPANPESYTIESPAITLAAPTRTNYTFGGWYDTVGLTGTAVTTISAGSTGHKTFWAKWTVNTNRQPVILTVDGFAGGAVTDEAVTLTKPGGTKTVTITGSDDDTQAAWYLGLVQIHTGRTVTLDADRLSLGTHTLRVTAEFDGVRYSKEITLTVED